MFPRMAHGHLKKNPDASFGLRQVNKDIQTYANNRSSAQLGWLQSFFNDIQKYHAVQSYYATV